MRGQCRHLPGRPLRNPPLRASRSFSNARPPSATAKLPRRGRQRRQLLQARVAIRTAATRNALPPRKVRSATLPYSIRSSINTHPLQVDPRRRITNIPINNYLSRPLPKAFPLSLSLGREPDPHRSKPDPRASMPATHIRWPPRLRPAHLLLHLRIRTRCWPTTQLFNSKPCRAVVCTARRLRTRCIPTCSLLQYAAHRLPPVQPPDRACSGRSRRVPLVPAKTLSPPHGRRLSPSSQQELLRHGSRLHD